MLTVEAVRKAFKRLDEQTKNIKVYLFMSREVGEEHGLKDGQVVNQGSVQIVFNKRLQVK